MWISHTRFNENIEDAITEVEGISDRATAIVASALVEDHLTTALKVRFRQDDDIISELFNGTGPLAAFSTKIKIAFLIGLFSDRACKDLQNIRKIRNKFAHHAGAMNFNAAPIKDIAMNLTLPDWYNVEINVKHPKTDEDIQLKFVDDETKKQLTEPKHRFVITCRLFIAYLTVCPISIPPEPRV